MVSIEQYFTVCSHFLLNQFGVDFYLPDFFKIVMVQTPQFFNLYPFYTCNKYTLISKLIPSCLKHHRRLVVFVHIMLL